MDRSTVICDDCKKGSSTEGFVKSVKIKRCPHCGSAFMGGWSDRPLDEANAISTVVRTVFRITDPLLEVTGDEYNRKVSFEGISERDGEHKKGQFFLHTSLSTCPTCTKKLGNYHEAILQLRGDKGERLDQVRDYVVKLIESAPSRDIFLTKLDKKKEGYDLYLSDKQYARTASRRAIEKFGGTYKETSHLVGMKKGTELYRITISIRIPNFQKSDVLGIEKELFLVISIKSDTLTLLNLRTKSIEKMKLQDLEQHSVYRMEEDIREADVLYRRGKTAYILDPFDFKEREIVESQGNDKVKVIKIDDEIFVVPSV